MKIICSIGPNVKSEKDLDDFIKAGMDSMRLNFSHADYEGAEKYIGYIKNHHPEIEIIQDLQGNKLRVSKLFKGQIKVKPHDRVIFCSEGYYNNITYKKQRSLYVPVALEMNFSALLSADKLLMKDATMEFNIIKKGDNYIETKVVRGGMIRGEKGINAPGMNRTKGKLTNKDKNDIVFGLEKGIDVICLSYVSTKDIIEELSEFIDNFLSNNPICKKPKIWAKIECRDGIKNIDEIIQLADGIMIGRGDLAAEIELVDIPFVENTIIKAMQERDEDLIIATSILETMRHSIIPSIAEVESIAYFTKAKVNGIMLAGEVGVGKNPIDVITTAKKIIERYR